MFYLPLSAAKEKKIERGNEIHQKRNAKQMERAKRANLEKHHQPSSSCVQIMRAVYVLMRLWDTHHRAIESNEWCVAHQTKLEIP